MTSSLSKELLTNPEHLKHSILTLLMSGSSEEAVRPLKEQLFIVTLLDMELSAFCANIEMADLRIEEVTKVTERIDEIAEQCKAFLKVQSRELARESLKQLREEHRLFLMAMNVRQKARS